MGPSSRTAKAILSADTSRDAEQVQLRAWRSMPPGDKIRQIAGLCRAARELAVAGLRARHPDTSEAGLVVRLAAITLGSRLARQVYPDAPMNLEPPYGDDLIAVTHRPTGIEVDLFTASSLLDRQQLARRRRVQVGPDRFIFVHSPEDILLQKLHWYRAGHGVSERQWRDALSIILVQGQALDRE
jgi:hypothetical protein